MGTLVSRATHIDRTLSLPFRENFLATVRDMGHLYAIVNLSCCEHPSLHMCVAMWLHFLDLGKEGCYALSGH